MQLKPKKDKKRLLVGVVLIIAILSVAQHFYDLNNHNKTNVTDPGEIVATFDNGDGTYDYIRRNQNIFQLEINYPGGQPQDHVLWGVENKFDYNTVRNYDKDITNKHFLANFEAYLAFGYSGQQNALGAGRPRYPFAGAATNEVFKHLAINQQPVDEVREYVDSKGKTWYIWYYKDIKLQPNNQIQFEN